MTKVGGLRDSAMCALLLLCVGVGSCPDSCVCTPSDNTGQWVYCSVLEGDPFPMLPHDTIILDLRGNGLRSMPPGSLDHLMQLRDLRLIGNNWECSCRILYLKHWLEDHQVRASGTRCSLPDGSQRSIRLLSGNEFPDCRRTQEPRCWIDVRTLAAALCVVLLSVGLLSYAVVIMRRIFVKPHKNPGY